jgi:hypothetical protein
VLLSNVRGEVDHELNLSVGLARSCGQRRSCDQTWSMLPRKTADGQRTEVKQSQFRNCSLDSALRCVLHEDVFWKVEVQPAIPEISSVSIHKMSKSLRILVPVKRVIDYAVSLTNLNDTPKVHLLSIRPILMFQSLSTTTPISLSLVHSSRSPCPRSNPASTNPKPA